MTHTPGRYSVHQKKTLLLPLLYKLAMPDNQFMFSSSSLLRPGFELRTLAGYTGCSVADKRTDGNKHFRRVVRRNVTLEEADDCKCLCIECAEPYFGHPATGRGGPAGCG